MMPALMMVRTATPWLLLATTFAVSSQAQVAFVQGSTAEIFPGQVVIGEATYVVEQAKQDPAMEALVHRAKAIFIVPRYGEVSYVRRKAQALTVTSNVIPATEDLLKRGSPGAFLIRSLGGWSSPTFFTIQESHGSDSPDTYPRGTSIVMVFMTNRGAQVMQNSPTGTSSLSGLKVTPYSNAPGASFEDADVVVWTPDRIPSTNAVQNEQISFRYLASGAYYNNQATLWQILHDAVSTDRARGLQTALTRVASSRPSTRDVE